MTVSAYIILARSLTWQLSHVEGKLRRLKSVRRTYSIVWRKIEWKEKNSVFWKINKMSAVAENYA